MFLNVKKKKYIQEHLFIDSKMFLNVKKKMTYLRHEHSKFPACGELLDLGRARGSLLLVGLGLGIVHHRVRRFLDRRRFLVDHRRGIGLGELERIGDRRGRKGRGACRGRTRVQSK